MDDSPLVNKIIPNATHLLDECANVGDFITMSKWNTNLLTRYLPKEIVNKVIALPIQITNIEDK